MESIIHEYNMSLLISEQTVLRDSSTRRDLNFFVLLRFDVVKLAYVFVPLFWFYKRYYFCK